MLPSVRGLSRWMAAAVLLLTGIASATAVALLGALIVSSTVDRTTLPMGDRRVIAGLIGLAAVGLDLLWARTHHPRPWAVHRQVPQAFGHRRGPRLAALRYGPRLGVGPATILTSWLWWAAFIVGSIGGYFVAVLGALSFAIVRGATMIVIAAGVCDGQAMATRMAWWRRGESWAQRATLLGGTCVASLALGLALR